MCLSILEQYVRDVLLEQSSCVDILEQYVRDSLLHSCHVALSDNETIIIKAMKQLYQRCNN